MAENSNPSVEKAYNEGYTSTRDGDVFDDMCSGAIGNTPETKAYNDGAKQGTIDRSNYGRRDGS